MNRAGSSEGRQTATAADQAASSARTAGLGSLTACVLAWLLAGSALVGCTYDAREVEAFLQKPRSPVSGTVYRVFPPDTISIRSQYVPEINGITQKVRPDGKIDLPLLGEITVAGLTPKEIESALTSAAREYYEQVDANVDVVGYNSQSFYVIGQVAREGPMPWTGRDTLLDALAKARPTLLAWPERIVLVRGDSPQVGGRATTQPSKQYRDSGVHPPREGHPRHRMTFNLMAMVKSGDMANNVLLRPNDIIYVQPNPFAAVGLKLQQILFPVSPVLETVRVPRAVERAAEPED